MALLQTGVLHLGPCIIVMLLTCGDFSNSNKLKIGHWINETADEGETVVLYCNGSYDSGEDFVWRKDGNLLFIYSPFINQTVSNYTSSSMSVDPRDPRKLQISNVQPSDSGTYICTPSRIIWILTINGTHNNIPGYLKKTILYTVSSAAGAVAVFCIILCTVWIHRKCKTRTRKNEVELQQPHGRRMDNVQDRQYFERFNSLYGQIVS
ncbi:hypothetical protein AMEX_G14639 [Astyanax mexicanus]|uniref:Ig-like domain-containing protein n=1 Tax=Astyanax mexicanus TaxID=7994 RepID=A0A8T2LPV7_ASTMX|nr:hypothetical protein AMEX_G14639 [Astyanax mexicanus]